MNDFTKTVLNEVLSQLYAEIEKYNEEIDKTTISLRELEEGKSLILDRINDLRLSLEYA